MTMQKAAESYFRRMSRYLRGTGAYGLRLIREDGRAGRYSIRWTRPDPSGDLAVRITAQDFTVEPDGNGYRIIPGGRH